MFRQLPDAAPASLTIMIDDVSIPVQPGENVAAVLLRQPEAWGRRTPVSGEPRAPYCMMGVCFDCLAYVDGVASVQTCLETVRDGMRVRRQTGKRRLVP